MNEKHSFLHDLLQPTFLWMVGASVLAAALLAKRIDDRVAYLETLSTQIIALRTQTDAQAIAVSSINAQLVAIHDALITADHHNSEVLEDMRALEQRLQTQFNALLHEGRIAP